MADFKHGIKNIQRETSTSTPNVATSGIPVFIGTAPVHQVGGKAQAVTMAMNYSEAVTQLGYSDGWKGYTLCEAVYAHFRLFKMSPCFFINVLDPAVHKKEVAGEELKLKGGQGTVPFEAIADTLEAKAGATALVKGTDYLLFYNSMHKLVLERIVGGGIATEEETLLLSYTAVDPTLVVKDDIIGGFDLTTRQNTGLELINDVFPKFQYVPDLIVCPGFSKDEEIAVLMQAKAEAINGQFTGHAIIDADSKEVKSYQDVPAWKKEKNIFGPRQILCWPKGKLGDKVFNLSTLVAGRLAATDYDEDCPAESPSNKPIFVTSLVLDDENNTEVVLDEERANVLNRNGIVTASNFGNGTVLWGNSTACFPSNTDPKDYFINISRMFSWVGNTLIHTLRSRIDRNIKLRIIENIVNTMNIWFNSLVAATKILGGRVELRKEENSELDLFSGTVVFHYYLGFSPPMQAIENILEYDTSYLDLLFA